MKKTINPVGIKVETDVMIRKDNCERTIPVPAKSRRTSYLRAIQSDAKLKKSSLSEIIQCTNELCPIGTLSSND